MRSHNESPPPAASISYRDALLLAALPYRKSVQAAGGFAAAQPPAAGLDGRRMLDWNFLRRKFRSVDLQRAQAEADSVLKSANQAELADGTPIGWVNIWEASYPPALRAIYDPPPVLFFANAGGSSRAAAARAGGPATDLARMQQDFWRDIQDPAQVLCVVGTRQAEPLAIAACEELLLGAPEQTVLSGLALGIDRAAHAAAIRAGRANVAVLGAGLRRAGPRANLDLPRLARERGLPFWLVSEFPPDQAARPAFFPRRNRILAGLAARVALMQAPARSGALITARFALEEGRDVCAFDHALLGVSPACNAGSRELIAAGARCIELPGLERRLVTEAPFRASDRAQRMGLRRECQLHGGMQWLGGRHYLRARAD